MKFMITFLFFLINFGRSTARLDIETNFIKSFILNEQIPTFLIFCDLCWKENEKVYLASEISKMGGTVSTSLRNVEKYEDHFLLFLLDRDCQNADHIIELASSKGLFRRPYRWLVLTSSTEENKLKVLMNSPLLTDSELVLAEKNDETYIMSELHKPSLNYTMIQTHRGFFNGTLTDVRPHREQFRRRMDLMGQPLTMANVIQDSNRSMYHLPREDGLDFQNDPIAKISWINAKVAFLMLNATPRFIFSYRWGYKVNGQWSGMINDLNTGKADIGTNCVVTDKERLAIVAYTDTIAPFKVRFIFRQPPLSYVANIYSLPFSSNLWIGIGVCAAVSAFAICIAAKWELQFGRQPSQLDGGISDALFWTMSAVSQQGCDMEPRRIPGRIMEYVVFTALMALYAAYSANIVVLLQAPSHSIKTLPQLANSKITLAANDVDYNHFIFKQYKDPVRVAIYKKIKPEKGKPHYYDLNEGVERIRQGLFAFHSIDEPIYRRVEQTFRVSEKCDLADIDFMNAFLPYAPMKKDSAYLELMRVAFKRIRETGIYAGINRRYLMTKPVCENKVSSFSSVGISDLKPVLALMGIGFGASVAVLIVEIAVFHLSQHIKFQRKWNQDKIYTIKFTK